MDGVTMMPSTGRLMALVKTLGQCLLISNSFM
jgi:hypothetical protein